MLLEQTPKSLNVSVYHSPVRIEMGIPCHFGPSLRQFERGFCPEIGSDTVAMANSLSSILALTVRVSVSVCLSIDSDLFFSRRRVMSQTHMGSLLKVEQNSWLQSSLLFWFQLLLVHNWDGCCLVFLHWSATTLKPPAYYVCCPLCPC